MLKDLNLDTEMVVCPIVRENDGLAMSTRNQYLNSREREACTHPAIGHFSVPNSGLSKAKPGLTESCKASRPDQR